MARLFAGTPFDRPPHCERCEQLESACTCPKLVTTPLRVAPGKQTVRLALEKRPKGKMASVIRGLTAQNNDLPALLTQLKSRCGSGGTLDGDTLELQGDHLERLRALLSTLGYQVRG